MAYQATTEGDVLVNDPDTSPTGAVPGGITPFDNSKETITHTFQYNEIDSRLKTHSVVTDKLKWDKSMAVGYRLLVKRAHPAECNMYVKHLAAMYSTWSGSIDYEIILSATGFNGGRLIVATLPPHVNPDDYDMIGLSGMPHHLIDAKCQNPVPMTICDQRPIAYHFTNQPPSNSAPPKDTFGQYTSHAGYLVIAVFDPLLSANDGLSSINFSVRTKLGKDFVFSQLIPPVINTSYADSYPNLFEEYNVNHFGLHIESNTLCVSTIQSDNYSNRAGMVDRNGSNFSGNTYLNESDLVGKNIERLDVGQYKIPIAYKNFNIALNMKINVISNIIDFEESANFQLKPDGLYFTSSKETNAPGVVKSVRIFFLEGTQYPALNSTGLRPDNWEIFNANRGESLIYFNSSAGPDGGGYLQPTNLTNMFSSKVFADVIGDPCYVLINNKTRQPLMYFRITSDGFLSTNKPAALVQYALGDVHAEFYSLVDSNASLPVTGGSMTLANDMYRMEKQMQQLMYYHERNE